MTLSARASADDTGRFRVEGLIPGLEYRVRAHDVFSGAMASERFIAGVGDDPSDVTIRFGE